MAFDAACRSEAHGAARPHPGGWGASACGVLALAGLVSGVVPGLASADGWGVEAHLGTAWNVPLPLRIAQRGAPDLDLTGRWKTRAFEPPLYYVYRLVIGESDDGWALDLVHHKIYLDNPPPEVEEFAISHGYNLILLSRLRPWGKGRAGAGAGAVVAHPENTVRGRKLDETRGLFGDGYYLSGPSVAGSGGRTFDFGDRFYVAAEVRLSLAWARVPVVDGHANVPNLALHATVGLGLRATR